MYCHWSVEDATQYDSLDVNDVLNISELAEQLREGSRVLIQNSTRNETFATQHSLSARQIEVLLAGGLINWVRIHHKNLAEST